MSACTQQQQQAEGRGPAAQTRRIAVVLVLYKSALHQSPAYVSLVEAVAQTDSQSRVHLLVFDNSPEAQTAEDLLAFTGEYRHQPSNPGLAASFNVALGIAQDAGEPWLMLLDQDTMLTAEYMHQALQLTAALDATKEVVALVPRLAQCGQLHSPYSVSGTALPASFSGISQDHLQAFNSGAVLRCSAVSEIGGFPRAFWLDFLDHATFHLLQKQGGMYVMPVTLQHNLFTNAPVRAWDRAYLRRRGNILRAEGDFYRLYGTTRERWHYRLRLVRHGYGSLKHLRLPMLCQALAALARSL